MNMFMKILLFCLIILGCISVFYAYAEILKHYFRTRKSKNRELIVDDEIEQFEKDFSKSLTPIVVQKIKELGE